MANRFSPHKFEHRNKYTAFQLVYMIKRLKHLQSAANSIFSLLYFVLLQISCFKNLFQVLKSYYLTYLTMKIKQ